MLPSDECVRVCVTNVVFSTPPALLIVYLVGADAAGNSHESERLYILRLAHTL